jgi:predicted RNase H-related nuclease YkuK (DUF458 family)
MKNILYTNAAGQRVNLVDYTKERIHTYQDTRVYIGTDSQSAGRYTHYATVVAFRRDARKGVHFVWHKTKIPCGIDHWSRLWKEVELTVDAAEYLKRELPSLKISYVELDFNGEKSTLSNKLVSSAKGWMQGLGYNVLVKPDEQVACQAADWLLR